jgi:hypothetical protein
MSTTQQKVTRNTRKQDNVNQNRESNRKYKQTYRNPKCSVHQRHQNDRAYWEHSQGDKVNVF